jgi:hypothetical protein
VIEEQRRHQVALVERFQHVDRIHHARRLGIGELLHERFDSGQVRRVEPDLLRLDDALLDAAAE